MRIGINTLFLVPGDVGGTEVYLRENLKEMIPGNPDDTFVLFTSQDNHDSLLQDLGEFGHVEFVQLKFRSSVRPFRIIGEQTLLPLFVRKQNIDVLWSPGYTAPLFCSCPQVVTIHDLQYKSHPDDLGFFERITLDFLVKNACRKCDSIIAVSKFSKNEIVRFNFASGEKIHVVYEGVDPAFGNPVNQEVSNLINVPDSIPYILCVAHTYPHKQVHVLIQAFEQIMQNIPHELVLVGKPRRGEGKVLESLEHLPDQQRVHRIGSLNYSDLISLYQKADLFVLPSEYEGFGLPILEALQAGTVVITTPKASIPEVGGTYAVYITKTDPDTLAKEISETLSWGSEKKAQCHKEGKTWASTFTWKKSAKQTIGAIKHLV